MDALNDLIRAFDFKTDNRSQPLPNRPNPENSAPKFGHFHPKPQANWNAFLGNWGTLQAS